MPVQPGFKINVIPTVDSDFTGEDSRTPDWSEIFLIIEQKEIENEGTGRTHKIPLTRNASEAIAATLWDILHPYSGKSIIEGIWSELDDAVTAIHENAEVTENDKGYARGLAYAIAHFMNPYDANVNEIRKQAGRRHRLREEK